MNTLEQRLANLQAKAEERGYNKPAKPAKVVQLPLWPEPVRSVPNSFLRGALFAAIQGRDRQYLERELLITQNGIQIYFTGKQLNQSDLDVWEQALHLARMHPLGTCCEFTAHGFLKALGRSTGRTQYEDLKNNFARLGGCFVEITHNHLTYGGSLLELYRDEKTQRYRLEINSKIKALYDAGFTQIDWQQRQQLARKPLALWLHGFYASHADPYPMRIEKLMQLSGSRTKQVKHYKVSLKKSMALLQSIGAIREFEIKDGLVFVNNLPSRSQQRHLKKTKLRNPKR